MPPPRFLESRTQTVPAENATSTQAVPPEALLIFQSSEDGGTSDIFPIPFLSARTSTQARRHPWGCRLALRARLGPNPVQVFHGSLDAQGDFPEISEYLLVEHYLFAVVVTEESVAGILKIEHIVVGRVPELEQGEGLPQPTVQARGKWDYLDGNGWPPSHLDELLYLLFPYPLIPQEKPDHGLVEDEMHARRFALFEKLLPRHADFEPGLNGLAAEITLVHGDSTVCVVPGLQQAGHEEALVQADRRRCCLILQVGIEGRRYFAPILAPPRRLPGGPGQLDEPLDLGLVSDA